MGHELPDAPHAVRQVPRGPDRRARRHRAARGSRRGRLGGRARARDRHAASATRHATRPPTRSPGSPSPTTSRCATGSTARSSGSRARRGSTPRPVGPWLVTPDEVGGTEPDLEIGCEVDGVVRQASRTSELVFSPVDLVAYVSEFVTLEPGRPRSSPARPRASGTACTRRSTCSPGRSCARSSRHIGELEQPLPRRGALTATADSCRHVTSSPRSGRPISPPWSIPNSRPSDAEDLGARLRAVRELTGASTRDVAKVGGAESPRAAGGRAGRQAPLGRPAARARRRARRRSRRARRRRVRR